jgi:hypothetical protein
MSKPIIVLDAFLDREEKKKILISNLQKFKKFNIPILLIGNSPIPIDIQKEVDYVIYDKENLMFKDSYIYEMKLWRAHRFPNFTIRNEWYYKQEHGLSVLCNLTKAMNFVKNLGFTKFIHFEWDFFIDDEDHVKFKNFINSFINSYRKAFFVDSGEVSFLFWMVDIEFWIQKFPKILNEKDYKKFLQTFNNPNQFLIAEKCLLFAFKNYLSKEELIDSKEYEKNNIIKSTSLYSSDFNFEKPNTDGWYKGLFKIYENSVLQNKLLVLTYNKNIETEVEAQYFITFDGKTQHIHHKVKESLCMYTQINNFDFSKFPLKIKTNCGFEKIYNSINEIDNELRTESTLIYEHF